MSFSSRPRKAPAAIWWLGMPLSLIAVLMAALAIKTSTGSTSLYLIPLVLGLIMFVLWAIDAPTQPAAHPTTIHSFAPGASMPPAPGGFAQMPYQPPQRPQPPPQQSLYNLDQLAPAPDEAAPADEIATPAIYDDPMFKLDPVPAGLTCYMLPKRNEEPTKCQDAFAIDTKRRRFAVTDGATTSFIPRPWARLVARGFVTADPRMLDDETGFLGWLSDQGKTWRDWVESVWAASINSQRERRGQKPQDYSAEINRKGAQATLVGCAFNPQGALRSATIFAVGDAVAFWCRKVDGKWTALSAFPKDDPASFDSYPATLATIDDPKWRERTWQHVKRQTIADLKPADAIVLTSDSLAQWILFDANDHIDRLLTLPDSAAFAALVEEARAQLTDALNDDDTTMLVIPVSA